MAKKQVNFSNRMLSILKKKFPSHNFTLTGIGTMQLVVIDGAPCNTQWSMTDLWTSSTISPKDAMTALEQEIIKGVGIEIEAREGRKLFNSSIKNVLKGLKMDATTFYRIRTKIAQAFYEEARKRHSLVGEKKLLSISKAAATTFLTDWIQRDA